MVRFFATIALGVASATLAGGSFYLVSRIEGDGGYTGHGCAAFLGVVLAIIAWLPCAWLIPGHLHPLSGAILAGLAGMVTFNGMTLVTSQRFPSSPGELVLELAVVLSLALPGGVLAWILPFRATSKAPDEPSARVTP